MAAKSASTAKAKSVLRLKIALKSARKALNKTWDSANRAPMFQKAVGSAGHRRTNRLIGAHSYKIAASGAAATAFAVARKEASELRIATAEESKRSPVLPSFSAGARNLLEAFLCAYVQSAASKALVMKELGKQQRLTPAQVEHGFEIVDGAIREAAAPCPAKVIVFDQKKKRAKKAEKEGKSPPPAED
jgi:hypothetical protein